MLVISERDICIETCLYAIKVDKVAQSNLVKMFFLSCTGLIKEAYAISVLQKEKVSKR